MEFTEGGEQVLRTWDGRPLDIRGIGGHVRQISQSGPVRGPRRLGLGGQGGIVSLSPITGGEELVSLGAEGGPEGLCPSRDFRGVFGESDFT